MDSQFRGHTEIAASLSSSLSFLPSALSTQQQDLLVVPWARVSVWNPPVLFNQKDLLVVSWARVSVWNPPTLFKQKYLLVVSHCCGSKSYKVQRLHQRLPKCCLLRELQRVQQCPHHPAKLFLFGAEVRILVWPGTSEWGQHGGDVLGRGPNCQHDPTRIQD